MHVPAVTVEAESEQPTSVVLDIEGTKLSTGEAGQPEKSCILVIAVRAVIESVS